MFFELADEKMREMLNFSGKQTMIKYTLCYENTITEGD